jgi:hypothetical protein
MAGSIDSAVGRASPLRGLSRLALASLALGLVAFALCLPHAIQLLRGATTADDVLLLWPVFYTTGPGVEHLYSLLGLAALVAALIVLRRELREDAVRALTWWAVAIALVPCSVGFARFAIGLWALAQVRAP